MSVKEISISQEVLSGIEVCEHYTPKNGEKIRVLEFVGSSAFVSNAVVKLIWDFNGTNEEVLWSHKGEGSCPVNFELIGDNVKKIAVCLDNGENGPLFMSGYLRMAVKNG